MTNKELHESFISTLKHRIEMKQKFLSLTNLSKEELDKNVENLDIEIGQNKTILREIFKDDTEY